MIIVCTFEAYYGNNGGLGTFDKIRSQCIQIPINQQSVSPERGSISRHVPRKRTKTFASKVIVLNMLK